MGQEIRRGRLTACAQNQMKNILLQCYEEGLSAYYTAQKTGHDIKTVSKYFNKLSKDIEDSQMDDYLERQKLERIQVIISYDSQLDETVKLLSQVNLEIEANVREKKPIPRHLLASKLEILKFRSSLVEKKAVFSMQPTMNEVLQKKIKEIMEEHGKS